MSNLSGQIPGASRRRIRTLYPKLLSALAIAAMLLGAGGLRAGEPDEDYAKIYGQVQEAESLESSGQSSQALAKYRDAYTQLKAFQKSNPDWNSKVVNTRLNRLAAQITELAERPAPTSSRTNAPAPEGSASNPGQGTSPAGSPKLLQPGAEPRQVLRLHPKVGDHQAVDLSVKVGTATKMGAMEGPTMKIPTVKLTLEVTVNSVSPQGDIGYKMEISDAGVADEPGAMPQMAEMMKAMLSKAKGMSGSGTVSDRGVGKPVEVQGAGGADAASRQVLDQMKEAFSGAIVPLPEEPVGVGAKWEVRTTNKAQGVQLEQTQTYELVSVEGDRLKAKTTSTERAGRQKIPSPMGGMGSVEISKLTGNSTGQITCLLSQLLPSEGLEEQHRETTMSMGNGTQKQTVNQKMDMSIRLQVREASATPTGTDAPQKQ